MRRVSQFLVLGLGFCVTQVGWSAHVAGASPTAMTQTHVGANVQGVVHGLLPVAADPGPEERLAMVNLARSQRRTCGGTVYPAAPPLKWDARLEAAARGQSEYQSQIRTMTHDGAGGADMGERITTAGFPWRSVAENVGWNYPNASDMLQGWLASPGHCVNIMRPTLTHVGWARVDAYDTMDLARLRAPTKKS